MRTPQEWDDIARDDAIVAQRHEQERKRCAERRIATGKECPECGAWDTEDNGATEYRCKRCDHRWGTENGERYGY